MKNFFKSIGLLVLVIGFVALVIYLTSFIHGLFSPKYDDSVLDFIVTYGGLFVSIYVLVAILRFVGSALGKVSWWKKIIGE